MSDREENHYCGREMLLGTCVNLPMKMCRSQLFASRDQDKGEFKPAMPVEDEWETHCPGFCQEGFLLEIHVTNLCRAFPAAKTSLFVL